MTFTRNRHPALFYTESLYAPEDAILHDIRVCAAKEGVAWQIGANEGKILQLLIHLHQVKTIVEVGTLTGYSALWMARALPEGGHLYTLEQQAKHAELARHYLTQSEVAGRITLIEGDAHETLHSLNAQGPFDMMFIDAEKPGFNAYLDWAERNIRKGGLIVADNTYFFGSTWQGRCPDNVAPTTWEGVRRFNLRLADPQQYLATILPTDDGLSVAIKLF